MHNNQDNDDVVINILQMEEEEKELFWWIIIIGATAYLPFMIIDFYGYIFWSLCNGWFY